MSRCARCRGIGDAVWLLLAYYDMAQYGRECTDEQIAKMLEASLEDIHSWRGVLFEIEAVQPIMIMPLRQMYMIIDRGKVFNFTRKKAAGPENDNDFLRSCGIKFKPPKEETS